MPGWWAATVASWLHSERLFVVAAASVVHALSLWLPCLLFVAASRLGFWARWRLPRERPDLQATTPHNLALNSAALREAVLGTVAVLPAVIYLLYPLIKRAGMPISEELPPTIEVLGHLAGMLVGCDTLFYWCHRALHTPALYGAIHKQHHEFKATTVWASEYFGPVDMVLNIAPGVVPAVLMQSHFGVLLLFTAIRGWQTVQSHAGYELPFDPCNRGPFHGGARRHDFHHSHNHGCYGDWTPFWDWACGTDTAYSAHWNKRRNPR